MSLWSKTKRRLSKKYKTRCSNAYKLGFRAGYLNGPFRPPLTVPLSYYEKGYDKGLELKFQEEIR